MHLKALIIMTMASILQCLFFVPKPTVPMLYSSIKTLSIYRNASQLQKSLKPLLHLPNVNQNQCQEDSSIKYIELRSSTAKLNAVFSCNIHAQEIITAELCVDLIQKWVQQRNELLSQFNFTIFYLANKMRESIFTSHDFCLRVNENGVDMNRNFPTGFGANVKFLPGSKPLSQKYTQCLDRTVSQIKPDLFIDFHSGEFSLDYFKGINNEKELALLTNLQQNTCKQCRIYLPTAKGMAFCDFKQRYKLKYSFLLEIYGAFNDQLKLIEKCFTMYNPINWKQLRYFLGKWVGGVEDLLWGVFRQQIKYQ